ncbi:MAG: peptide chain release factor N(5)-glutamine methyltransferase [Deltaproteobacteria bacterium]|nr:peptide chain release factor N(5)-glutamine methyltransferase [Deltaproteobacteria bacterium]
MNATPPENWTILKILIWTTDYFRAKGASEPRASAEVLLAHTLGLTRLDLYLRHDQPLSEAERSRFRDLVRRRAAGAPVAYLTGHKEFYSLDFLVTPATLIPRPETEFLVDAAVEAGKRMSGDVARKARPLAPSPPLPPPALAEPGEGFSVREGGGNGHRPESPSPRPLPSSSTSFSPSQDGGVLMGMEIGVGSGAVVAALAKELPQFRWVGIDVSAEALGVARTNIRRHGLEDRIHLIRGNLLTALRPGPRTAIMVANLPYVPDREWEQLPREIRDFEPARALKGGPDGLDLIRPLIRQAPEFLAPGGRLVLEVGAGQAGPVREMLRGVGSYDEISTIRDYGRIERVVQARRI